MSEAVKRLKANRRLEGTPCGWCESALMFGEDAATCGECGLVHHAACWDGKAGCGKADCVNAPLKRLPPAAPPTRAVRAAPGRAASTAGTARMPAGKVACPHCGHLMSSHASFCRRCKKAPTPDGVYRGPKRQAEGATTSLVYGILAFFVCGIIFGILAITSAQTAKRRIQGDPRLTGEGYATAGLVLGIIALGLNVLFIIFIVIGAANQ